MSYRRHLMMMNEFKFVKAVVSNGKQLLDTGLSGGTNCEYDITFQVLSTYPSYGHFFGSCRNNSASSSGVPKVYNYTNKFRVDWYANGPKNYYSPAFDLNHIYNIKYKGGNLYIDDVPVKTIGEYGFGNYNFCICGYYPEPTLMTHIRLFSAKLWKDGVLARDYVPIKKGGDGYLLDKVTKQLFGSSTSYSFSTYND